MRTNKKMLAAALAGMMAVSSFPAMGAPTGPGAVPEADTYDAETLARLEDNILEYDEIANRVHDYNPEISKAWDSYMDMKEDYKNMLTELESQYPAVKNTADSYISAGKLTGNATLEKSGKSLDKGYRNTIQGIRDTVNKWDTNRGSTKELRKAEKQVTSGAQQALIGYESMRQSITTLETMVRLYERQAEAAQHQMDLGLGTQKDLLSAQSSLLSARSQLASLQSQMDGTRRTVCYLLGYDPDSNPEIAPVPEFDMSRLEGMNLEADTTKAIGNNYTLISQRNSAAGKTNSQVEHRRKVIDEGDQKLTVEMNRLYQDVMDKKAAYDAAVTGFTAAQASYDAAGRQFENGLTSELQYLGQQIAYYQKKAAKDTANLSLLQAMETYDWAIDGFATVE